MQSLALGDALLVVLIGMVIVFFGLVVLIALIKLLVKLTSGLGRGKKKAAPAPAPKPAPVPAVQQAAPAPAEEQEDTALVAAITAALALVMEGSAFQVKRIRRIQNTPDWQRAGREEQIYSHF